MVGLVGDAGADAFLRVIAQKTPVHSGPGPGYREVAVAERGQVFTVLARGTRDYWFKVELDDGTSGWILGDAVFPFEVGEEPEMGTFRRMGRAIRRAILGPSPAPFADIGMSFSAGLLDREGVFLLRPSWLIDPYWALEGFGGLSPRSQKDIFLGGVGFVLRLAPGAVIGPYVNIGVGAAHVRPKADNFVEKQETLMALAAGGGIEITFKKQITLRLDARNWTLFDENNANNGQEYSGGLAIFF
ncbi:MAG TPA: SH3 domain-containing protein [Methylomirabilota bacterium]|nr:SH3 domain-containing protein [Methylomirabilota bacterium]